MNWKTYKMVLVLCLTFGSTAYAQDYKEIITNKFIEQTQAMKDGDFEKSLSMTVDALFNLVPKEQMVQVLQSTFNNPQMQFDIGLPEISEIGEKEEIEGKYYVVLTSKSIQKIKFFDAAGNAEPETGPAVIQGKTSFETLYGKEHVSYDAATGFLVVNVVQKALAVSEEGKTDWKFLAIDKNLVPFLGQILPQAVVDKVK